MKDKCIASIEEFDSACSFEDYNIRNCHRLSYLTNWEDSFSVSLPLFEELDDSGWKAVRQE